MREMIKLFIVVAIFSAVAGGLLAQVKDVTASKIDYNKLQYVQGPTIISLLEGSSNDPISDNFKIVDNETERKFFIGEIQPWSTRIQRRAFLLLNPRSLEELLAAGEPQAFRDWRRARDSHITRALEAPRRHVEALLPVMRQCGLAPSA